MPKHPPLILPLATLALTALATPPVAAQEPTDGGTPGVLVSQQICDMGAIDDLNQLVVDIWAPILDAAVADGRLTGWGVLNHYWGDEWNWLIYYAGDDVDALIGTAGGLLGEVIEAMPGDDPVAQFGEWCSAHKDNLYVQPIMQSVQPPGPGGD
jgi:hypothetical protein